MNDKKTKLLTNLKMSKDTYVLRRKVIEILYEFKKVVDLPRIDVRVAKSDSELLGVGRLGCNIIWITVTAINLGYKGLRHVVIHEVGHAVFNLGHNENDTIMRSHVSGKYASKYDVDKFLKKNA